MSDAPSVNILPKDHPTGLGGLPGLTVPQLPGTGPHDFEIPHIWWKFDDPILKKLGIVPVRGLAQQPVLTDADRKTIASTIQVIKAARIKLKSDDPKLAIQGQYALLTTIAYLSGLFDAKAVDAISPGALVAAQLQFNPPDLDSQLDELERQLGLLATSTRFVPVVAGIAIVLIGAGIGLKIHSATLPETVPDK